MEKESYCLFAMAKMEEDYIVEWVNYHLDLGFSNIYLYDNEDKPKYDNILSKELNEEKYQKVKVIHYPGAAKKGSMQNIVTFHFTINFSNKFDYIMHIDVDEFVNLKKHNSIQEFKNTYIKPNISAIAMNWVFYGSNGHKNKSSEPVRERFTKCMRGVDKHIKLFIDRKKFVRYVGCHKIISIPNTYTIDTKGKIITGLFNIDGDNSVCQINHYKVKSEEEFRRIVKRPRPDMCLGHPERFRDNFLEEFPKYDFNEIDG